MKTPTSLQKKKFVTVLMLLNMAHGCLDMNCQQTCSLKMQPSLRLQKQKGSDLSISPWPVSLQHLQEHVFLHFMAQTASQSLTRTVSPLSPTRT